MREKLIKLLCDVIETDGCSGHCNFPPCYLVKACADHLIANGVTIATDNWIPVSDSPKERGCYLVTVRHWLDGKPVSREAYWNGADWLSCYKRGEEITPRVTHWMPLPEPPKGE